MSIYTIMTFRNTRRILAVWLLSLLSSTSLVWAQQPQRQEFSLQEAIQFATSANINVQTSRLDAASAESRIKEVKSTTLPQVSIGSLLTYNAIIQRFILPAGGFGAPSSTTAGSGTQPEDAAVTAIPFGVNFQGNVQATVNQLLFDASYKIGLKAAATLRELSQKNVTASKINVAEQVAKAYYNVLVSEERIKLLDYNISRIDSLYKETQALNKQGFVEKIDVDRLEVQSNNLKAERQNVQNLIGLSYYLLKFQMGLGTNDVVVLTDKIQDLNPDQLERSVAFTPEFDYSQRVEFSVLQSQITLADLDYQSIAKQYFPRVVASATYGHNNGRNNLGDFFTTTWFNSAAINLQIQVPVFDGFQKRYAAQQRKIALDKARLGSNLLKNSIDLQIRQSQITIQNSLQTLRTQKRNLDLAQEILRVTRIKYKEGVGSNIEVLNAESSSREAQTNYFASLLDFMLAKVDYDKATGKLYTGN
ncbi:outer membrane protein TolC [Spirosoma lacussanchae]|uniref:TolC family protein n=1 Tax=Spirosoma lacussanchae TaxID=1884249 RepID=UPI001FE2F482|nr:TolC family protein [Spirosoma lacussanchae]